jgi:ADP-heptose:LPS heptosyltransferase
MALTILNPYKKILVYFFNCLFRIAVSPWLLTRKNGLPSAINRILIIRLDYIGDVIMATGVVKACFDSFPNAEIYLLAPPFAKDLLLSFKSRVKHIELSVPWWTERRFRPSTLLRLKSGLKYFSIRNAMKILKTIFLIRKLHLDVGIDLRGDFRTIFLFLFCGKVRRTISYNRTGGDYFLTDSPAFISLRSELNNNLALLKCIGVNTLPFPYLSASVKNENLIRKKFFFLNDKYIIIHPKADSNKNWGGEKFGILLKMLSLTEPSLPKIITGTPLDEPFALEIMKKVDSKSVINICGKTSLREYIFLVKNCKLIISCDTGVLHIAQALLVPSVALFGPTSPARYVYSPTTHVVSARRPCGNKEGFNHLKCRLSSDIGQCMKDLDAEEVSKNVLEMLKK